MSRICIIRHHAYPQETHVRRDAETLVHRGHEVSLLCLRDPGQPFRESISGVSVVRLPVRHRREGMLRYLFEYLAFFLLAFVAVSYLHLRNRFDSIEVDTMPDFLVFCTLVPKLLGAQIVLYLFEAMPEAMVTKYEIPESHPMVALLKLIERWAIRYASRVITACEAFRVVFVARGAPAEKITVLLNVPNEQVFPAIPPPLREKPQAHQGLHLITHGTLTELYGVQVAIRAAARLREKIPGLKLTIPGDGEFRLALEELVRSLQLEEVITFTGWIPQSEVVKLILESDVGIVPILSGYGELMVPNKLFEYVALGKPVVCSSLAGIRYYFDSCSLLYFDPGDDEGLAVCVERLHREPQLGEDLARAAWSVYERNCWTRAKETYCRLHERADQAPVAVQP